MTLFLGFALWLRPAWPAVTPLVFGSRFSLFLSLSLFARVVSAGSSYLTHSPWPLEAITERPQSAVGNPCNKKGTTRKAMPK